MRSCNWCRWLSFIATVSWSLKSLESQNMMVWHYVPNWKWSNSWCSSPMTIYVDISIWVSHSLSQLSPFIVAIFIDGTSEMNSWEFLNLSRPMSWNRWCYYSGTTDLSEAWCLAWLFRIFQCLQSKLCSCPSCPSWKGRIANHLALAFWTSPSAQPQHSYAEDFCSKFHQCSASRFTNLEAEL